MNSMYDDAPKDGIDRGKASVGCMASIFKEMVCVCTKQHEPIFNPSYRDPVHTI